jgi:hypothetical protein
LDKLGELTSDVGDETSARKFDDRSTRRPHTGTERTWIEATVRMIIRRVAALDYDPSASVAQITMADLPKL